MSTVRRQYTCSCKLNDCNFGRKFAATIHSFWKVPKLPILVFEHATHMACLSVTLVCREVTGPKPGLPDCYDHVMFALQQTSDCDFLRGVCLHCRKIGMIYMRY